MPQTRNLVLTDSAIVKIREIREKSKVGSDLEVVLRALRVYEKLIEEEGPQKTPQAR